MLYRSITERIEQFFEKEKKAALMVTGPAGRKNVLYPGVRKAAFQICDRD